MSKDMFFKTGINSIDEKSNGILAGEVTAIASRPSGGKSRLMQEIAWNMCGISKYNGMYISIDRSKTKLTNDIALFGSCSNFEIEKSNLEIIDTPEISIDELIKLIESRTPEVVFIDSFILIGTDDESEVSFERYQRIMRQLKTLARKLSIPVVITVSCVNNYVSDALTLNEVRGAAVVDIADLILGVTRTPERKISILKNNHLYKYKNFSEILFELNFDNFNDEGLVDGYLNLNLKTKKAAGITTPVTVDAESITFTTLRSSVQSFANCGVEINGDDEIEADEETLYLLFQYLAKNNLIVDYGIVNELPSKDRFRL